MKLQQQAEQVQQSGGITDPNTSPDTFDSDEIEAVSLHHTPGTDTSRVDTIESQLAASYNVDLGHLHMNKPQLAASGNMVSTDRLLDMFYENFWDAFPFILPYHYLNQRKLHENHGMDNLLLVLQWIGSIYAPWASSEPYYEAARLALSSPALARDPWSVQALMLFAIGENHQDSRPESRQTLKKAIALALELQMNAREFARAYGEASPVLEESWRRTYCFLALTDQHFAVVINSPVYLLRDVPNLVDLPCDDEFYVTGVSLRLCLKIMDSY
jgi:hypothetical protein